MLRVTRHDTTVGVFMLVAVGLIVAFFVTKAESRGWLRGTKRFTFKSFDGRGLKEQAPVRMRGVDVGQVESILMDDLANVEVTFRVEARFASKVHDDATATIISPPVLGLTFVELDPGDPGLVEKESGAIQAKEAPTLMANVEGSIARIESIMRRTDQALEKANRALEALSRIATDVAEGQGTMSRLIKDDELARDVKKTAAAAAAVVDDLTEVTDAIRRREGAIGRLIASDAIVVEAEKLVTRARGSLDNLDEVTQRLTASVELVARRLDEAAASVGGLKGVVDNTRKLTDELAELASKVNRGQGSVGKLMTDDAVFLEARALLKELRESVQDLREQAPINSFIGVVFSAF